MFTKESFENFTEDEKREQLGNLFQLIYAQGHYKNTNLEDALMEYMEYLFDNIEILPELIFDNNGKIDMLRIKQEIASRSCLTSIPSHIISLDDPLQGKEESSNTRGDIISDNNPDNVSPDIILKKQENLPQEKDLQPFCNYLKALDAKRKNRLFVLYLSFYNQEEACKAYILSQAFNGWEYYKTYSDGGISGGTMERPGLKTLLNDIRACKVQVVVVYKVDRLSRSIIDFHKMMQEFDKYGCNFVSITQSFDTSNSMGKLTLNMLLSFAQFEREVSAERVRDKIAASKAKGLWMGGTPPLGYDLKDKQLIPNPQEAEVINLIFTKYLELGNIQTTADWMNQQGYRSKCWQTVSGAMRGGHLFRHGSIQRILGNPVYIGKIAHLALKKVYPGKHKGIISQDVFESVQAKIGTDKEGMREHRRNIRADTLLGDVLVDEQGRAYKLSSGRQGVKVFKYYVIRNGAHLSVGQLDGLVLQTIQNADYRDICPRTTALELSKNEAKIYLERVGCQKIDKGVLYHNIFEKTGIRSIFGKTPCGKST